MDPEIHAMLQHYSCNFYTTNHILFTENLVAEVILDLKAVPQTDFGCLTILPDPISALSKLLSLSTQPAYDEVPQTTKDGLGYLKRELALHGGKKNFQQRTFTDGPVPVPPPELFLPIIGRSSQKKTPLLNKSMNGFRAESHASLLSSQGIKSMKDPEQSPLSVEDILVLGYKLDEKTAPAVKALLQSTANMIRPYKNWKNPQLDPQSISADGGRDSYKFPRIEFLPIFPRVPPEVQKKVVHKQKNVTFNLPTTHNELGLELDTSENIPLDPSLSRENLVIVDGWETIHSSPPSAPSTPEDEVDELDPIYMNSTPDTKPTAIEAFASAQMIPVAIPRCRDIGGTADLTPHLLANKSVASFLTPLLSQPNLNKAKPEETDTGSQNLSVIGQASSHLTITDASGLFDPPYGLNEDLEALYENQSSPYNLRERLGEIRFDMMDVPDLPEPNEHERSADFLVPTSFAQFLKPKTDDSRASHNMDNFAFLEKTKGQRSLALSLSWVSFTTTEKLPTIPQIVGVDDLDLDRIQPQVERVLGFLRLEDKYKLLSEHVAHQDDLYKSSYTPPSLDDDFQLLLTRQEIKRVVKRSGTAQASSSSDNGRGESENPPSRSFKRPRLDTDSPAPESLQNGQIWDSQQFPPSSPPLLTPPDELNEHIMIRGCTPAYEQDIQDKTPFSSYLSYISSSPHRQNIAQTSVHMDLQYDEDFMDIDADGFQPLSLDSYPLNPAAEYKEASPKPDPPEATAGGIMSQITGAQAQDSGDSLSTIENSLLAQNSLIGIFDFARLRGKRVSGPVLPVQPTNVPLPATEHLVPSFRAPAELADKNTLLLSKVELAPTSVHLYLGSLDVIQKRGLVLALNSPRNLVDISERESLHGADLAIDPYSAIIFFSLFTLPARLEAYLARVCAQSWKFKRVFVIFEAFPESWARLTNKQDEVSEVSAYTPHILKAIRRFRRDVEVAAACQTMDVECVVQYAFADTVDEAASYVRLCGDIAESEDMTDGQLWHDREWMSWKDQHDEEIDLAYASGINSFSAALLLCDTSVEALLSMSPEQRLEKYGPYIGHDAVVKFNADVHRRHESLLGESEISTSDILQISPPSQ